MSARYSALIAVVLLMQGCATLTGGPEAVTFLDLSASDSAPRFKIPPTSSVRLLTGETIEACPLSDGALALAIPCPEIEIDTRFKSREQLQYERRAAGIAIQKSCLLDAVRMCRLRLRNVKSSFALLGEYMWSGDDDVKHAMIVRCLTNAEYRELRGERQEENNEED